MSSGDFRIVQTTDDREIIASFQRQQQEIIKLLGKFSELKAKGNQAGGAMGGALNTAVAGFGRLVGALTGVGSVIGGILAAAAQVRREVENIRQMQSKGAEANISFENIFTPAIRNAGGLIDQTTIKNEALRIAKTLGTSPTKVAGGMSEAFTAAGPTNTEEAMATTPFVEAAMRFAPEATPAEVGQIAGAGIDISKRTGQTPTEAIGFIAKSQSLARVTDLSAMVDNYISGLGSMLAEDPDLGGQPGATAAEASALIATITQESTDKKARSSRTAAIQFQSQLRERFGGTLRENLETLWNNPEERDKFLKGGSFTFDGVTTSMKEGEMKFPPASFEAKSVNAIKSLAFRGTRAQRGYLERVTALQDDKANEDLYFQLTDQIAAGAPVSRAQRQFRGATEINRLEDQLGGITGVMREEMPEFLQSLGETDLSQRIAKLKFDFSGGLSGKADPFELVAKELEGRAKELEPPPRMPDDGTFEIGGKKYKAKPGVMTTPPPNVDASGAAVIDVAGWGERVVAGVDRPKADALRRRAAELRQQRDELRKSNPELFKPIETTAPAVSPPAGQPRETSAIERSTAGETEGQIVNLPPRPAPAPDRPQAAAGSEFAPVVEAIYRLIGTLDRPPQTMPQPVPNVNVNVATNDRPADRNFSPRTIRPTRSSGLDRRRIS